MLPTAAASAGASQTSKIVPNTKIIKEKSGRKETSTSFKITERGGMSSAGGFGASSGFKYALVCITKYVKTCQH